MPLDMYRPCRNCGQRVPLAVSECPYCGTFAPGARVFGRGKRRLTFLIIALLAMLAIVLVVRYCR